MAYTYTTLAAALVALRLRVQDPSDRYWSLAEKQNAIVEALRIWQCAARWYKQRLPLATVASTMAYDLRALFPNEYSFAVTDRQIFEQIQLQLQEPAGLPWPSAAVGATAQFDEPMITGAMQRRRDQFLMETGIYAQQLSPVTSGPPAVRFAIPDSVMDIRRAVWNDPVLQKRSVLFRDDDWGINAFAQGWIHNASTPKVYSAALTPPAELEIAPAPDTSGDVELVVIQAGPQMDPYAGVQMGIPDDWVWAVKYGAIADLLNSDGPSRDPLRAKWAQSMWKMGVDLARDASSLMFAGVNDNPIWQGSVFDLDVFTPNWMNAPGKPTYAGMASHNLLYLGPKPDAVYGVTIDLLRTMPVPAGTGDYIQVGREQLDAILDMSQHTLCFKLGGAEFVATEACRDRFMKVAAVQNARLLGMEVFKRALEQPVSNELEQVRRMVRGNDGS